MAKLGRKISCQQEMWVEYVCCAELFKLTNYKLKSKGECHPKNMTQFFSFFLIALAMAQRVFCLTDRHRHHRDGGSEHDRGWGEVCTLP